MADDITKPITQVQDRLLTTDRFTHWRSYAAIAYIIICVYDFCFAPLCLQIYIAFMHLPPSAFVWIPLTLGGGGLFHMAYGAILGVTAWGKTQENLTLIKQ